MEETQTTTQESTKHASQTPNRMIVFGVIAIVLIGAGIFYFTTTKKSAPTEMDHSMQMTSPTTVQPTTSATISAEVQTITVEAGSFYYKPNTMTVKKGQPVKIVMHSVSMMHNFNIDELNVHSPMVKNGDTATFEFTPTEAGTFEYYCSVGQHRQLGQVGKITVE